MKVFVSIVLMFISIALTYGLVWVVWEYLWLSIPLFIASFLLYKREFPGWNWGKVGFRRLFNAIIK